MEYRPSRTEDIAVDIAPLKRVLGLWQEIAPWPRFGLGCHCRGQCPEVMPHAEQLANPGLHLAEAGFLLHFCRPEE